LAGVDVICTDKTGTLTEGKIVLDKLLRFASGGFTQSHSKELLQLAVLCNDAHVGNQDIGDLLDISLLRAAVNQGASIEKIREEAPRIEEIPFDSQQRWQATLHKVGKEKWLIVKGAPDTILSKSVHINKKTRQSIEEKVHQITSQGLRVLAIARKKGKTLQLKKDKDVDELTFEGLLIFSDRLRHDAAEAVKQCSDAGIQVIMVTGDHLNTAISIAEQVGLHQKNNTAILGEQLHDLNHLTHSSENLTVVARATPFDKTALIDHLKSEQKLVAMTGDGVNDAPALVRADIGIAMGKSGTDAAREAADMVLVDDAFSTIVHGVSAARGIFENIRKVISYLFTTSFGELGVIFIALILNFPLQLIAAQILWMNLITDGLLDICISTESVEPNIMKKSNSRYKGLIIDKLLLLRIIILGSVMAVGTMIIFITQLRDNNLEYARTSALIVLALFQWFHAFNSRNENKSLLTIGIFTNRAVIWAILFESVLLALAIYNPILQKFLQTVPVKWDVWVYAVAMSSLVLVVEEIRKFIFNRFELQKYFTK
jgi:P-type Ca2+ transporter type 2C